GSQRVLDHSCRVALSSADVQCEPIEVGAVALDELLEGLGAIRAMLGAQARIAVNHGPLHVSRSPSVRTPWDRAGALPVERVPVPRPTATGAVRDSQLGFDTTALPGLASRQAVRERVPRAHSRSCP